MRQQAQLMYRICSMLMFNVCKCTVPLSFSPVPTFFAVRIMLLVWFQIHIVCRIFSFHSSFRFVFFLLMLFRLYLCHWSQFHFHFLVCVFFLLLFNSLSSQPHFFVVCCAWVWVFTKMHCPGLYSHFNCICHFQYSNLIARKHKKKSCAFEEKKKEKLVAMKIKLNWIICRGCSHVFRKNEKFISILQQRPFSGKTWPKSFLF